MKKIIGISLLFILMISAAIAVQAQNKKLTVYYFHTDHRCPTCLSIEANTQKTLDTYFKDEVKAGKIELVIINVDDKKNEKIAEKFEASGSALILNKVSGKKELKEDMTNFAFKYSRNNETKFIDGLKEKINKLLK